MTMANEMVVSGGDFVWDDDKLKLMKQTVAAGISDAEFKLFVEVARTRRLNPFTRQIYALKRKQKDENGNWIEKVTHQTGIDGFRVIAERTGKYAGQLGPFWCGDDGVWKDVWLDKKPPSAAKVGVLRTDFREPIWGTARYSAYVQTNRDGGPNRMWATMSDNQLAKCAEALALRRAFPEDLSGLYTSDEMDQADKGTVVQAVTKDGELVAHVVPSSPTDPKPADPPMDEMAEALAVSYDKRIANLGTYDQAVKLAAEMNADARLPKLVKGQLLGHCRTMARSLKDAGKVSAPERVGEV